MVDKNKFCMLFVDGKSEPSKKHFSKEDAEQEAERLTRKEKCPVFLLEAVSVCEMQEAPLKWNRLDWRNRVDWVISEKG